MDQHQPPQQTAAAIQEAEKQLKLNALKANAKSLSHIVPPSHILSDDGEDTNEDEKKGGEEKIKDEEKMDIETENDG
eukprot:15332060-Ditylum_brightwellii.AAC.1